MMTTLNKPKQARSVVTRRNLLDAAITELVEQGYAGLNTASVARRAGVSQGALFKHFASKNLLLGAAIESLFERLIREFRASFTEAAAESDRVELVITLLWRVFQKPELRVVFETYTASHTNEPLRRVMGPVLERHRNNLFDVAQWLFPGAAETLPDFVTITDLVISTLQGAALGALVSLDPASEARLLAYLIRNTQRELTAWEGTN